jgi:hypothetical protein
MQSQCAPNDASATDTDVKQSCHAGIVKADAIPHRFYGTLQALLGRGVASDLKDPAVVDTRFAAILSPFSLTGEPWIFMTFSNSIGRSWPWRSGSLTNGGTPEGW